MSDAPILLSDLLDDTRAAVEEAARDGLAGAGTPLAAKALDLLGGEIDAGVRDACAADLVGLLVDGWTKADAVRAYADPAKAPVGTPARMALGSHPLGIDIDPGLTLVVPGWGSCRLELIVGFVATIDAALLVIEAGAITAVEIGRIGLAATLKWGAKPTPLKLKTRALTLPGRRRFDPGFAIARRQPSR